MKKIIVTLLTIILVSMVAFADPVTNSESETHTIRLKMSVTNVRPEIQLVVTGTTPFTTAGTSTSTSTDSAATSGKAVSGTGSENDPFDIGFSISKGGRVTISAILVNETNTTESYKLTFGDGNFENVVRQGRSGGIRGPEKIITKVGTAITTADAGKGISSITYASGASGDNRPIVVSFNGKLDTAAFPNGVVLATAEYEYMEDRTIDPGTYYANVTLEVAAN